MQGVICPGRFDRMILTDQSKAGKTKHDDFRLIIPWLVLYALGLLYTYLNIGEELFVKHLGCGCVSGFNTNSLTMTVCFSLLAMMATACGIILFRLPSRRVTYALCCGFIMCLFFFLFTSFNLWL